MKNYTSQVPANKSIGYIEKFLSDHGALSISKHYDGFGKIESIFFQIKQDDKIVPFKLPANIDSCFNALYRQIKRPKADTRKRIEAQAERTAWKIISDWVEIQITMIELEQAEFLEVFLPYVHMAEGQTFYQKIKSTGFKMLPGS